MSSVVITGDTSGSITLAAPAVAGSNTLTLPANTGTVITTASSGQSIPKAALPTGSVLQVVSASTTNQVSQSTTSYVTTNLTASITPTSATSKILVFVNLRPGTVNSGAAVSFRLYRNGSNVFQIGTNTSYVNATGVAEIHGSASSVCLDSPSSTSSVTYEVYFAGLTGGQFVYNNINNDTSTIALLEIASS